MFAKGRLLACKSWPFTAQFMAFYNAKGGEWATRPSPPGGREHGCRFFDLAKIEAVDNKVIALSCY